MSRRRNLPARVIAALVVIVLASLVIGCEEGVRFADLDNVNVPVPVDVSERMRPGGLNAFSPEVIVGAVIYDLRKNPGYFYIGNVIRPAGAENPELESFNEKKYEALVNDTARVSADILDWKVSIGSQQMVSVSITDVARAGIPENLIDWQNIPKLSEGSYPPDADRIYYVFRAIQSVIATNVFGKIDADAEGVIGPTFGAKGGVYNSKSGYSFEKVLGVWVIPVHEFLGDDKKLVIPEGFQNRSPIDFTRQYFKTRPRPKLRIDSTSIANIMRAKP